MVGNGKRKSEAFEAATVAYVEAREAAGMPVDDPRDIFAAWDFDGHNFGFGPGSDHDSDHPSHRAAFEAAKQMFLATINVR